MRFLVFPLVLLTGCVTASNFDTVAADRFCDSFETCDATSFNAMFDDQAECHDRASTFFQCYQDNCEDFDAKAANECLGGFATTSEDCDGAASDPTGCDAAWSSCDSISLGLCAAAVVFGGGS